MEVRQMIKTTYADELGKCVRKEDNYRAYKDGGIYALYIVGKELIWNTDNTDYKIGTRLEAVKVGYFTSLDNFGEAVDRAKEETAYLMSEGK
jgi:hypothetical protein